MVLCLCQITIFACRYRCPIRLNHTTYKAPVQNPTKDSGPLSSRTVYYSRPLSQSAPIIMYLLCVDAQLLNVNIYYLKNNFFCLLTSRQYSLQCISIKQLYYVRFNLNIIQDILCEFLDEISILDVVNVYSYIIYLLITTFPVSLAVRHFFLNTLIFVFLYSYLQNV